MIGPEPVDGVATPDGDDGVLAQVVREVLTGISAEQVWTAARTLGWLTVGVDEAVGGSGGTLREACTIVRLLGSAAVDAPVAEAMLASWLLAGAGWLSDHAGAVVAVVLPRAGEEMTVRGTVLDGAATRVPGAAGADLLLVAARSADHTPVLALVGRSADGIRVEPGSNLAGEPRDTVTAHSCPVLRTSATAPNRREIRERAALLRAAAIVGAVERAYQLTVTHTGTREQFGRPLSALQAVGHAVATMACEREQSRAALAAALAAYETPQSGTRLAAARVIIGHAATTVARLAHQLHGAVGITREHPLHRSTGRLLAWRDEDGSQREWSRTLGEAVLAEGLWEWTTSDRVGS